jgi:hypothetical protein
MLVVKNSLLAKANVSQPIFGIDFLSKKYLAIDCNKGCMIFPASDSRFSFQFIQLLLLLRLYHPLLLLTLHYSCFISLANTISFQQASHSYNISAHFIRCPPPFAGAAVRSGKNFP